MPINSISGLGNMLPTPIPSLSPLGKTDAGQASGATGMDFGGMLKQAIASLGNLGVQADSSTLKLASGQPVDIHDVMLNGERASLGFQLALQVRDKLVNAYQEVMRMSI